LSDEQQIENLQRWAVNSPGPTPTIAASSPHARRDDESARLAAAVGEVYHSGVVVTAGGLLFVVRADGRGGAPAAGAPDPDRGREIYAEACVACHGREGNGGHGGGPSLIDGLAPEVISATASSGRNNMPGFAGVYSPAERNDVAAFIVDDLAAD
jgi:mono/diheme cytochrome c family protein